MNQSTTYKLHRELVNAFVHNADSLYEVRTTKMEYIIKLDQTGLVILKATKSGGSIPSSVGKLIANISRSTSRSPRSAFPLLRNLLSKIRIPVPHWHFFKRKLKNGQL